MHQVKGFVLLLSLTLTVSAFAKAKKESIKQLTSKKINTSSIPAARESRPTSNITRQGLGLGFGQTMLMGDFKDYADDSIAPDIFYTYYASHSFDLLINGHFSEHKFKNTSTTISGLSMSIKSKLYNFDQFSPFIIGGLGIYQPTVKRYVDGVLTNSRKKVTFGTNMGAGADLLLNKHITVGVLGHYHNPFDIRQEDAPDVEGSYFKLMLTIGYIFNR